MVRVNLELQAQSIDHIKIAKIKEKELFQAEIDVMTNKVEEVQRDP